MILDQNGNTSIITQEKTSIIELVKKIDALYPKFESNNIIVNLLPLDSGSEKQISDFLAISNKHRKNNLSFVIVSNVINVDVIPEEIIAVPTLQEAYDIIEMEEIERDLGL